MTIREAGQITVTTTLSGLADVALWDVGDPNLYTVVATLMADGAPVHSKRVRIGFREADFRLDGFYLNGRRLKIFGVNRHHLYPFAGAMSGRMNTKDYVQDVFAEDDYNSSIGPDGRKRPELDALGPRTDRPYLISEAVGTISGPARYYRRIDTQQVQQGQALAHARIHNLAGADDRYCGVLAWSGIDYESGTGQNIYQAVKYTGVVDLFRVPKPGAAIYQAQVDPRVRPVIAPAFYWDFGPTSPVTSLPSAPRPPSSVSGRDRPSARFLPKGCQELTETQELTEKEPFAVGGRDAWWVRPGEQNVQLGSGAAYLTRTTVDLPEIPSRAIVRATALGMYELHVNGHLVRDSGLYRPGWTDTTRRLQYQEYDVTRLLRVGTNVVGAEVAPGWHGGRIGAAPGSFQRFTPPELRLLVAAETSDGKPEILAATGAAWEWAPSDITESDIYDGETADRRQYPAAWASPDATDLGRWERMEPSCGTSGRLVAQAGPTVRETRTLPVTEIRWLADGTAVADTGRNENGFVRVAVAVDPGTQVTVGYGELVDADGYVYQENLRSARCRDVFTCAGGKPEELAPRFTFRSFRYAQISGLPNPSALVSVERAIVGTDLERVGWFECSDPLLNEIYQAVLTSQRANFLEVPTDCPQRDERLGWMADALLFAPLAAYNYDISGLMSKWFDDILDARTSRGLFTDVAPRPPRAMLHDREGAPAWADAGVLIPWLIYERYGDREVLERMFPAMLGWLRAVHADNPDGIWRHGRGNDYGDWVPAGPDTSHDLFATCWLFRSTQVAAEIARLLGRDEAAWLLERAETVRNAFLRTFHDTGTGRIAATEPVSSRAARHFAPRVAEETQTGYILPLVFGMLDDQASARCAQHLAEMVEKSGRRLETGFTGSAFILDALGDRGYTGLAYELLQRSEFPSLGYMITRGATSVWERWDGLQPGGGPASPTMNSFNHCALGSMFRWAIEAVCGLRSATGAVAFQTFRFAPSASRTLRWTSFRFASPRGQIRVRWDRAGEDAVAGEVAVPAGTRCLVAREVPDGDRVLSLVTDDLPPVPADPGAPADGGWLLGPGTHRVRWQARGK